MKKFVDNKIIEMTAEEVSAREVEETKAVEEANTKATEKQTQEDLKASARQKLMDGEPLTEDEAKTIVL
tara:strand:- start:65 stop:271 length:207 start_codon:yes stop_codon:yes gene_type:complete